MKTPNNKKSTQQLETLLQQQAEKIAQLERGQAIEAAIERIRASALTMHHSYEVKEVANVMRKELMDLGLEGISAATIWIEQTKGKVRAWDFTNVQEASYSKDLTTDLIIDLAKGRAHPNAYFWNIWDKKETYWVVESNKEVLYASFNWLVELDETMGKEMLHILDTGQLTYWWHASAAIKKGTITIDFVAPPPVEMAIILPKMATAFDLAYRRFEDLQRAEAQARAAQIEAAMERVRSAAMAMHKSEELKEVVAVIFEELKKQGFPTYLCSIGIYDAETKGSNWWSFMEEQDGLPASYHMPYLNGRWFKEAYEVWKNQIPFHLIELVGEEQEEHTRLCFEETGIKDFPEEAKAALREADKHGIRAAYVSMTHGLIEITTEESLQESQIKLLQRFTKVIDLTYTRVADLQQAEAQAREAQIEAALERVRAASMAMHHSNELMGVTNILFEQMHSIGLKAVSSWISLINVEADALEMWLRHEESEIAAQIVSGKDHPNFRADIDAWKNKEASIKFADDKADFIYAMKHLFGYEVYNHPDKSHFHLLEVYHRFGWLGLGTWDESTAEEIEICSRFAKVFEQTYTRFLDLQKAEAQAREAQIEAALERVRARAMAMRHSTELSKAAELLYQELFKLGLESFSCGYLLNDIDKMVWNIYLTNPGETAFKEFWTCPMEGDKFLKARYQSWKNKEPFHCAVLEGAANRAHHEYITQFAPWKADMIDSLGTLKK